MVRVAAPPVSCRRGSVDTDLSNLEETGRKEAQAIKALGAELVACRSAWRRIYRVRARGFPHAVQMLLAGNRLASSDETISQISSSIGYETDSAFGRAFRKFWGSSPREHRRQATVDYSV
jgi:AraC-like DNA-binding protein